MVHSLPAVSPLFVVLSVILPLLYRRRGWYNQLLGQRFAHTIEKYSTFSALCRTCLLMRNSIRPVSGTRRLVCIQSHRVDLRVRRII